MVKQYISEMWKTHPDVCTDISYIKPEYDEANQPLYIIDEDPVRLAKGLPLCLLTKYMDYIAYSTIVKRATPAVLEKSGALNKPRVDYMFKNQRTALWFFLLYEEMQNIYKSLNGRYYNPSEYLKPEWVDNYTKMRTSLKDGTESISLIHPDCMYKLHEDIFRPYKWTHFCYMGNVLEQFRFMMMVLGFLNSEFPYGAPAWYSCARITIWKSYSKITRLFYRIDTSVEGVYHYFYSVDDNNWVEIANVPAEMRSFIDSIIFARNT